MSVAQGRKYIMFIRAHGVYRVGHKVQMRTWKADELIEKKIAIEYTGRWSDRNNKMKFNLKDLK